MTEHDQQLINSIDPPEDRQSNELRETTDDWIRHAMDGIRLMHLDEGARREVAKRLF
ncbi:hypothetical protein [Pandoraea sp. SD6-2]|uniref:hypothetical protein n=1 Tax=Pandoraea sp. SD6-2 TaxID=1286093 RepID=UPI0003AA9704|nr:hypothetical protein [Pandoraea sp. SD6-2]